MNNNTFKKVPRSKTKLFKESKVPDPSVFIDYRYTIRTVIHTITSCPVSKMYCGTRIQHDGAGQEPGPRTSLGLGHPAEFSQRFCPHSPMDSQAPPKPWERRLPGATSAPLNYR